MLAAGTRLPAGGQLGNLCIDFLSLSVLQKFHILYGASRRIRYFGLIFYEKILCKVERSHNDGAVTNKSWIFLLSKPLKSPFTISTQTPQYAHPLPSSVLLFINKTTSVESSPALYPVCLAGSAYELPPLRLLPAVSQKQN